jgi:hypothetical protein
LVDERLHQRFLQQENDAQTPPSPAKTIVGARFSPASLSPQLTARTRCETATPSCPTTSDEHHALGQSPELLVLQDRHRKPSFAKPAPTERKDPMRQPKPTGPIRPRLGSSLVGKTSSVAHPYMHSVAHGWCSTESSPQK